MAKIEYIINGGGGGANVNPRSLFMPINVGGTFVDSLIKQPSDGVITTVNGSDITTGVYLDTTNFISKFGDWSNEQNNSHISIDDLNEEMIIKCFNIEFVTNSVVGGVHTPSGRYLQLRVNGADYLIELLNI